MFHRFEQWGLKESSTSRLSVTRRIGVSVFSFVVASITSKFSYVVLVCESGGSRPKPALMTRSDPASPEASVYGRAGRQSQTAPGSVVVS